jgi:hypothetical protein
VRLEVLDTGIGIPAAALAHIYEEFYQVDVPTNTSRDGYGLGLSIVQRIVKLLGLKLEVRSELGKGSQFSLELPRGKQMQARARGANSAECSTGARRFAAHPAQSKRESCFRSSANFSLRDATDGRVYDVG